MNLCIILILLYYLHNKYKGISDILDDWHFAVRSDKVFTLIKSTLQVKNYGFANSGFVLRLLFKMLFKKMRNKMRLWQLTSQMRYIWHHVH